MLPIDTNSTIKEIVMNIVIGREKNGYPISFKNSSILCHLNNMNQRKIMEYFFNKKILIS